LGQQSARRRAEIDRGLSHGAGRMARTVVVPGKRPAPAHSPKGGWMNAGGQGGPVLADKGGGSRRNSHIIRTCGLASRYSERSRTVGLVLDLAMETEEECRRRAEDCVRLARLMSIEHERHAMLAAARRWRALAAMAGKATAKEPDQGTDGS
jgi:hypothetical protein